MEPNRHHEYQTHHQQPHQHQQLQQPQQPHHHQPHTHQSHSTGGAAGGAGSYGTHHVSEQERSTRNMYLMGARGSAASAMPPAGAALTGVGGDPHLQYYTSNRDLISSKKQMTPVMEQSTQHIWQYKSQVQAQAQAQAPAPTTLSRHHSNPMYIQTTNHSAATTSYWTPEEQQQHQLQQPQHQRSYNYSSGSTSTSSNSNSNIINNKPPANHTRPSAISSSISSNCNQRYYEEANAAAIVATKYSVPTVATSAKVVSYAPAANAVSQQQTQTHAPPPPRHLAGYELDQVVNPSNSLVAPSSEQQPSPNYGRKCPQHYEPPERSAAAAGAPPPPQPPAGPAQHHHQSLYMPMPQFSTEKFQTTVNNAIEKYVRETPAAAPPPLNVDYRRPVQSYARSSSYYGQQQPSQLKPSPVASPAHYAPYGGTPSSASSSKSLTTASYVKVEPEHVLSSATLPVPQPTRASLYHNPYNTPPHSDGSGGSASSSACCKEVSSPAAPHGYPTKYGKLLQQHSTPTPPPPPTSSAAQPTRASSTSYYYHGAPSPAAATVASPTPQLYTHTPPPSSTANYSTLQVYPHGPDICCQPQPKPPSAGPPAPLNAASSQAKQPLLTAPVKKTPSTTKPNYRALINDMLKRNTASEEERNLQIIKKTLNMETPNRVLSAMQPAPLPAPAPVHAPVIQQLPAAHSPLDLSMRTVKQTADSTEYKYQPPLPADYKPHAAAAGAGLPRFDITPNFSAATRGTPPPAAPTQPLANPTAVIRAAPSGYGAGQLSVPAPLPPVAAPALVIKSVQQLRPSVVETNPYAKRQLLACEQLPPETSIMALPKPAPAAPTTSSLHSSNPNYLGRKRHLQEYNQAAAKQARCEPPTSTVRAAEIPVIAVNEQAMAAKRMELQLQPLLPVPATAVASSSIIVAPTTISVSCKQEPLTPTTPTSTMAAESMPVIMPTPVPASAPAPMPRAEPRIRTKAELKGFTFPPPVLAAASSTTPISCINDSIKSNSNGNSSQPLTNNIQIKLEPAPSRLPTPPELELEDVATATASFNSSLLDWGNACNNLVEQLMSKVALPKRSSSPGLLPLCNITTTAGIKLELSEDDLPVARILKCKPLQVDAESAATTTSNSLTALGNAQLTTATTTNTNGGLLMCAQKKLSKVDREKKRLVQEQRIAARLAPTAGQSSSSESDTTELHKRKTERQKKPLMRKGKARRGPPTATTTNEKVAVKQEQSSDEEQQEEDEEEEEEGEEENDASSSSEPAKTKAKTKTAVRKATTKSTKSNNVQYRKNKGKANEKTEKGNSNSSGSGCGSGSGSNSSTSDSDQVNEEEEEEQSQQKKSSQQKQLAKKGKQSAQLPPNKRGTNGTRPAIKARIALNTMTRSKRKKELELQLANSKVLRNDKIIRNSTTKIKRKYVRKLVAAQAADKKEIMCTRLRTKRGSAGAGAGATADLAQLNGSGQLKSKPIVAAAKTVSNQQQMILAEYRYKLALKIPHRLISINKMNNSQKLPTVAASLPDLDRRDLSQELDCFKISSGRGRKPGSKLRMRNISNKQTKTVTPRSFIDELHLRVTSNGNAHGGSQPQPSKVSQSQCSMLHNYSETSQTSASNSLYEQSQDLCVLPPPLPPPAAGGELTKGDDAQRRHFSIFDTKVLQTKTRTESKLQQRREIIREIFEGPERPASAPPECAQQGDEGTALSYQRYEEILEQMNRMASGNNNKLARRAALNEDSNQEKPTGTAPVGVQCPHKRKYLRRKGSSGFDYIRKKKRPNHQQNNPTNSNNHSTATHGSHGAHGAQLAAAEQLSMSTANAAAEERMDDTDSTVTGAGHLPPKIKTEVDVCREIQKWVLNKGVGQSTMHKAARQGLIDVVVYCLDRMAMNPDQKDNAGYTPLHEACTQGWLEIARILLQYGANHSEAAQSGIRPLHGAIENDHEEVVRLLLSYGADPLLATYSGQTPLNLASSKLMSGILSAHLSDAQSAAADIKPMRLPGPWQLFDAKEYGYDIFDNVPNTACDMSRALRRERKSRNSNKNKKRNSNGKMSRENIKSYDNHATNLHSNNIVNGETSATKTATSGTATTMTTMLATVKLERIDNDELKQEKQVKDELEDSNNNKNNDELNNAKVENVTNVVNNVKHELSNIVNDNDNHKLPHSKHNQHKQKLKHEVNDVHDQQHHEHEHEMKMQVGVKKIAILHHIENTAAAAADDDDEDVDDADGDGDNDDDDDDDNDNDDEKAKANESTGDIFEFEEADVLLPPLYLLKDEGSDKWVLLNDLCNLLKVKSKDTLLNKICPNSNSMAGTQKQLLREFKMSDFLEKATCLQLLCAGEKINMGASKVVLIKYNESVRNLLGVKTIFMKF